MTTSTKRRRLSSSRFAGPRLRTLLRQIWFKAFLLFERLGIQIFPKSYYSPIPNFHWLANNQQIWAGPCRLTGIDWDLEKQLDWLRKICRPYYQEVAGLAFFEENQACEWGPGFGSIESQVLHCFVRSEVPTRILEIGSGLSTVCMLHASDLNLQMGRCRSQITCIDPYPTKRIQEVANISVLKQPCQAVSHAIFAQLRRGDLLFIDSSHAVKVGSDVIRIYLDVIPSLPPGVFLHIHDVNLPYLYDRSTLSSYFFANSQETALLTALLTQNAHLAVLSSLSALHYDRPQELVELVSDYKPQASFQGLCLSYPPEGHFPNSIWVQTC